MENKVTSNVVKGLIISLILIVLSVVTYFTGNDQASWKSWVTNIIFCAGIIWACLSYGKDMNRNVTFGNVFAHGFKTSAVVAVIMVIFTVIFILIFPEMKEKTFEIARQKMQEQNQLSDDQIETALGITKKFFMPFAIGGTIVNYLIIGVIASLIGAAVTKKDPRTPFENNVQA